jgi:hypothetical protein
VGRGAENIIYQSLGDPEERCPWQPEFGPEGKHFVSENSYLFIFWR